MALTATVIDNSIGSSGTPTGTVQFETNNVAFGSPVTLSGGGAVLPLPLNTPVGNYPVDGSLQRGCELQHEQRDVQRRANGV